MRDFTRQLLHFKFFARRISLIVLMLSCYGFAQAQTPNIDFEAGDLSHWTFYVGSASPLSISPTPVAPITGRHTLTSGSGADPYGGFPIVDPGFPSEPTFPSCNAHNYSLKLGNDIASAEAERASYTVHIPAGANSYHLYYRYALVLQDVDSATLGVSHTGSATNPPQLVVGATDSATGSAIACANVKYKFNLSTSSGYIISSAPSVGYPPDYTACRNWATTSVNLSGRAGHTVIIDFTTNDCSAGSHAGYAYIDFVSICSNTLHPCYPGNIDSLKAPSGFLSYSWYGPGSGAVIATGQTPTIASPSVTSVYTVVATPNTGLGCPDSFYVTVIPIVPSITGSLHLCVGTLTTLTGAPYGGTWSSSNPIDIPVDVSSGVVHGVGAGTATITYTLSPSGCFTTKVVTVDPVGITGDLTLCVGTTSTLVVGTSGGTWNSSNVAVATVGSTSGIVTGISTGTAKITYTSAIGCNSSVIVTVMPFPTFSGTPVLCVGNSFLQPHTGTGTWSSSNTAVATVGSTLGNISGVGPGTAVITYGLPECYVTEVFTVNPTPNPISGTTVLCAGATTTLTDPSPGGSWISFNTGVATISSSGVVTAISAGTATIHYYYPSTSCYATITITVNLSIPAITGPSTVCAGSSVALSASPPGGTWTGSSSFGTVDYFTGVVTGVSPGVVNVHYTASCGTANMFVTVNPSPAPIIGPAKLCAGSNYTYTDATSGGTWSVSIVVATINSTTGALHAVYASPVTITYTMPSGCVSMVTDTIFEQTPVITGDLEICAGTNTTLTNTSFGGTWSNSNDLVDILTPLYTGSGIANISGLTPGTSTIVYTLNVPECATSVVLTVDPVPAPITGSLHVCVGSTTTLADTSAGGTWQSNNTGVADVSLSGVVTGYAIGTATISYITTGGCFATKIVTVDAAPTPITGIKDVCTGFTTTLSHSPSGGTWSSAAPGIATIAVSTGVVTGVSNGTAVITYTVSSTCWVTTIVTVHVTPASIAGTLVICAGSNSSLTDATPSGTWSSSNTSVATIDISSGIVLGIAAGTSIITYSIDGLCNKTAIVTVNALPAVITGTFNVCVGFSTTLSDATIGGTWTSSDPSIASIVSSTGVISGIAAGIVTITYTKSTTGCYVTATFIVNPMPESISGMDTVCQGATTTYTNVTLGGTWSSSNTAVATINSITGVITGIVGGTSTITYKLSTGCYVTKLIRVSPLPIVSMIIAPDSLCLSEVHTISDVTPGGVWDVSDPSIIAVSYAPMGPVSITGLSLGTAVLSYTVENGCGRTTVTKTITVSGPPVLPPITGILGACSGFTTHLYDAVPGGTWTSSDPSLATVNPVTGVVMGIASGSMTITYTLNTHCGTDFVTTNVLVNMEPYITANFIVSCQQFLDSINKTQYVISGGGACIQVCDSTTIRYYANGVYGSTYTWHVAGGTVVADYGDSIDVFWSSVGLIGSGAFQVVADNIL